MRNELYEVVQRFARTPHDGVQVYDFGDGVTSMPIPAQKEDGTATYLTKSICYLYLEGKGETPEGTLFPKPEDGLSERDNGWLFFAVEIKLGMSPEALKEKLEDAKNKLLAARK